MGKKQQGSLGLEIIDQEPIHKTVKEQESDAELKQRLAKALRDPAFRKSEGFPIGTDEAILSLSRPPNYTACPNPFLSDWLAEHAVPFAEATDAYSREPFAADVSEGKNDPIYNAHSYHTKVPYKAIMRYILHYTEPGDVVMDGFCGTGMTGVAATLCGSKSTVEAMGYKLDKKGTIRQETTDESGDKVWQPISRLGTRKSILNDLSPAATFIAHNYNHPASPALFEQESKRILNEVEDECGWMYRTFHSVPKKYSENDLKGILLEGKQVPNDVVIGIVNYVVWSDVFICPECSKKIVFWDAAFDKNKKKVREKFPCPSCNADLSKKKMDRAFFSRYDREIDTVIKQAQQVPVLVNYLVGNKRYTKRPDVYDLALIEKIDQLDIPYWYPTERMPEGGEARRNDVTGLTHAHHFFTKRNLWVLSALKAKAAKHSSSQMLLFQSIAVTLCSKLVRYNMGKRGNGPLSGTLYVPSLFAEGNSLKIANGKKDDFKKVFATLGSHSESLVSCCSTTRLNFESASVDYIFTDPPFGGNLMYSELNFLWETWLQVKTANESEAIEDEVQKKKLADYQDLMALCFAEYYRVLKPGRWMTVEFHNSQNSVWEAIRESLQKAGFIIADVRTLDKQQSSFKQINSSGAVKQDLVISAYKPRSRFENRFEKLKGKPEAVLEFVAQHLAMLPVVPVTKDGLIETISERTRYVLYDRMLAYHLMHNARIPVSAAEFYELLENHFIPRDDMYFLPDQAARYDAVRVRTEVEQLPLFVRDERSAVQWIRRELEEHPQTLGDLTPQFMQAMQEWDKVEERVELADLLKQYFVQDGEECWRVPDPDIEKDREQVRRKSLLRIFEGYFKGRGALKIFRREALLEGFKECWQTKQYAVIVVVCERLPDLVLKENADIKTFYDIARDRLPDQPGQMSFQWK